MKRDDKLFFAPLIVFSVIVLVIAIALNFICCASAEPVNIANLDIYASEVASLNAVITAGSEHFYLAAAVGANPLIRSSRWIIGTGGGIKFCDLSLDVIHYKINEDVWTFELNELYSLRCIYAWDAGRVSVIAGLSLNRFISTLSDGTDYRTFSIREGSHGSVRTNWWPGFLGGVRF